MAKESNGERLPDYMRNYKGGDLDANIGPEDIRWVGGDGELNPDEVLEAAGYEPEGALKLLLMAIIDAHPGDGKRTREDRLADAEAALLGRSKKRGNREKEDEEILREVARRYVKKWFENPSAKIEIGPIVREALQQRACKKGHKEHSDSAVRRLEQKFIKNKDRLLARATTDLKWALPEFHRRLFRIFYELTSLGVAVDQTQLVRRVDPDVAK